MITIQFSFSQFLKFWWRAKNWQSWLIFFFRANGFKRQLEILISQHDGLDKVNATKILQQEFNEKRKWICHTCSRHTGGVMNRVTSNQKNGILNKKDMWYCDVEEVINLYQDSRWIAKRALKMLNWMGFISASKRNNNIFINLPLEVLNLRV